MARTNDPDSATAQFFINVKDNPRLDKSGASAGYCVFGKVVEGMDVVDKIVAVETDTQGQHQNVPVKDVTIKSIGAPTASKVPQALFTSNSAVE